MVERQLVVFELAQEWYGVAIAAVESIIRMQTITVVPHAPGFVEGVTNLRGVILPVIDLRKRLGLPVKPTTRETRIIVVEVGETTVGMIVDAVAEVLRVSAELIEAPSPLILTIDSSFITGIAKAGERLVILLDLGKVLTLEEQTCVTHLEPVAG